MKRPNITPPVDSNLRGLTLFAKSRERSDPYPELFRIPRDEGFYMSTPHAHLLRKATTVLSRWGTTPPP
ncbi:MAG: hypothetical protein CM15mP74_26880 [Halieaceae bacterium]|nr:MAG: hypothetical protein CM15mP74_26880 [Halieaceae bacterium]